MSEAERIGDITERLVEPCHHERTEVRLRTFSNGTRHLVIQCLVCGQMPEGARWLPQDGIDMTSVEPFDYAISERWRGERSQTLQTKLHKERVERHLEYERYIRESDEWWAIRTKVMNRDQHLCQGCLEENATEVHHKNYLYLYDEILFDLVAVCTECHKKIHGKLE